MSELIFIIVVLIAIVRGIIRFFQWVKRSIGGVTPSPAGAARPSAPMPMPERQPPAVMPPIRPPAPRERQAEADALRPLQTIATAEAPRPSSLSALTPAAPPAAPAAPFWVASPDALVRAFILKEILGPPLSQRRRAPH